MKKSTYEIGELIRFTNSAYQADTFHKKIVGTYGVFLGYNKYYEDELRIFSFIIGKHLERTYFDEIEKTE